MLQICEGRHAEDFFVRKIPTASAGFEPASLGTRGQHANHSTIEAAYLSFTNWETEGGYVFGIFFKNGYFSPIIQCFINIEQVFKIFCYPLGYFMHDFNY
jgi:hypothetical protein